jgi:Basic region leucine zipper
MELPSDSFPFPWIFTDIPLGQREQEQEQQCARDFPLRSLSQQSQDREQRERQDYQHFLGNRSLKDHIAVAFSLVEEKLESSWARKFLLDHSPSGTVQMMTNPAALADSVTMSVSDCCYSSSNTIARGSADQAGIYDHEIGIDVIIVPTFSSGELSVGMIATTVRDVSVLPSTSLPSADVAPSTGRVVRNDATGEMIVVKSTAPTSPNLSGEIQVMHLRHVSTRYRERRSLVCDPTLFGAGHLEESVLMASHCIESRHCPKCGASPATPCACQYSAVTSQHSVDFANNFNAVSSHFGTFRGSTTSTVVAHGEAPVSREVGENVHQVSSFSGILHDAAPRHSRLTVSKSYVHVPLMSHVRIEGWSARTPASINARSRVSAVLQSLALHLHASPKPLPEKVTGEMTLLDRHQIHSPPRSNGNGMWIPECGTRCAGDAENVSHLDSRSECTFVRNQIGDGADAICTDDTVFIADSLLELGSPGVSLHSARHDLDIGDGGGLSMLPDEVPTAIASVSASVSDLVSDSASLMCRGDHTSLPLSRARVPFVPGKRRSTKAIDEEELAARCEERRNRNRLAAARSNARRKQRSDGLKGAITSDRERIAQLEARRESLETENVSIRWKLARGGQS